jgi:hypothetical protein
LPVSQNRFQNFWQTYFKTVSKNGVALVNDTLETPIEEIVERAKVASLIKSVIMRKTFLALFFFVTAIISAQDKNNQNLKLWKLPVGNANLEWKDTVVN